MPRNIKKGDTHPPLSGRVTDASGGVPLGTADEVRLWLNDGGVNVYNVVVTLVNGSAIDPEDPETGAWEYDLTDEDPITAEEAVNFEAEIRVTWSPGVIQTFPRDSSANESVTIDRSLKNT